MTIKNNYAIAIAKLRDRLKEPRANLSSNVEKTPKPILSCTSDFPHTLGKFEVIA